jgi:hypothetical protein
MEPLGETASHAPLGLVLAAEAVKVMGWPLLLVPIEIGDGVLLPMV